MKSIALIVLLAFTAQAHAWDASKFKKPSDAQLKKTLSSDEYDITQKEGTDAPFKGRYVHNDEKGIYVDVVSGEPLFSSNEKFDSGTGWPSFWAPIAKDVVKTKDDNSMFATRTEVRSKYADSHLGHLFDDGPKPTGLRYCMDGSALRFIPASKLQAEGYGEYAKLFEKKPDVSGTAAAQGKAQAPK